jgi:UDP-glucose:(heptosyl)LPS alpha-1,3-glucosyltransferase
MRVAITHTRFQEVGGVERYIYNLCQRLVAAGHEIHYFCHFWKEEPDGITFHKVPYIFKPLRWAKVLAFDRLSRRAIESHGPFDIVHGFTKTSGQDIYTDGSGCLQDFQAYSLGRSAWRRRLGQITPHQRAVLAVEKARYTRGNFKRIITMSKLVQSQICSRYGLTAEEVEVVYNGIDLERFHPRNIERHREAVRAELGLADDLPIVLFVANDYERKGLGTLLRALAQLDGAVCLVIGKERSHRRQRFVRLAENLGISARVRFLGVRPDVEKYYAASDLFCLPTYFDAFGMVVLEAMATGMPSIISKAAGAAEIIVEGETGAVLPDPDDGHTLVELMRPFMDLAVAKKAGLRAREECRRFSWDSHFDRILEIYDEVCAMTSFRNRGVF